MAASSGHMLLQQRPLVEGRIKTLVNADLRAICRAYGQNVSGTKIQLQQRCLSILADLVSKGDVTEFNNFRLRVSHHGQIPREDTASAAAPQTGTQRAAYPQGRADFKTSPFFERVESVTRTVDLPEMPQNRHTIKLDLVLNDRQVRLMNDNPDQYKIMVYCAAVIFGNSAAYDIAFPSQMEIKVNEDDVKANFKGLKNKPGSTKPADVTKFVRIRAGYGNKMTVCYALTQKRFAVTTYLVRYSNPDALVHKIRANRVFTKHKILEEFNRQNADPDIAATSSKMSLKDPVSTLRITTPIRSTVCTHNQCFDASFFLQLQEQAPIWQCPICSKTVSFESLSVDKYFEEILQTTPQSIEQVTVEPDGQWKVVKDDEDKGKSNAAKGALRAAYDDDFDDDDLVELSPELKPKLPIKTGVNGAASFSTPPASSREPSVAQSNPHSNKRTSAVIDLTLSDEDEPPIRPNKRARPDEPAVRPNTSTMASIEAARPASSLPAPRRPSHGGLFNHAAPLPSPNSVSPYSASSVPSIPPFGRSSDLRMHAPSTTSIPNNMANSWNAMRSPSATFGETNDMSHRLSTSASPSHWQDGVVPNGHEWRPPSASNAPPQRRPSFTQAYTGFAQDQQVGLPSLQSPFSTHPSLPNGFSGGSSSN